MPNKKNRGKKQTTKKAHTTKQNNKHVKETQSDLIGPLPATNKQLNTSDVQTTPNLAIRFSTAVRNTISMGAVIGAVIGVVLATGGWYFNECINDRKQHLTEFMEIVNKRRAAQEKELQSITAIDRSVERFIDYLGQKTITVSEIEKQLDHIASLGETANIDCNTFKELNYKYHTSKVVLHKDLLKPPPIMPPGAAHQCELLAMMGAKALRPDAQKLYLDAKYRENYIASEQEVIANKLPKETMLSAERASENELIREAQITDSSFIRRVWNCL